MTRVVTYTVDQWDAVCRELAILAPASRDPDLFDRLGYLIDDTVAATLSAQPQPDVDQPLVPITLTPDQAAAVYGAARRADLVPLPETDR